MVVPVRGEETGAAPVRIDLTVDQARAVEAAKAALVADLRFEYLGVDDEPLLDFVGRCYAKAPGDLVREFMRQHGKEPVKAVCFFPVEYLEVGAETVVAGVRFFPVRDPSVPPEEAWFPLVPPVGCVAAVDVEGTEDIQMAERARVVVLHALRVLRVALRASYGVGKEQVRFRLGVGYALSERIRGWKLREDIAFSVELPEDLSSAPSQHPAAELPARPVTDIEKKADLALRWMERAYLVGEPLVMMLYLFFALEALLGDKSEKLKSYPLAFREMMLSHVVTGGFRNPNRTLLLYDEVRSGAVHGEDVPDVTWEDALRFEWAVRDALGNYLTLARAEGLSRRGRLLRCLDEHGDRPDLIDWLRGHGGSDWTRYLDELEG